MGLLRTLSIFAISLAALASSGVRADEACVHVPGIADVQQAAAKFPPRDRGVLWRLEKDGRTSWLYGTVHVGRLEWVVPGPTITRALLASDVVALELDLTQPDALRAAITATDAGASARVLAGGLGERLKARLKQACVPDAAAAMRPAMQAMTLMAVASRVDGFHPELGVDLVLTGMAPSMGKRIVGLETPAQQMAVLLPASESEEREMVSEMLDEVEDQRGRTMLDRLAGAWARGDAEEIGNYAQWCDCIKTDADRIAMRRLNDDRNPAMADKLDRLHAGGARFFAAVGALHLTGAKSLVKLLQERGFNLQRVSFEAPKD